MVKYDWTRLSLPHSPCHHLRRGYRRRQGKKSKRAMNTYNNKGFGDNEEGVVYGSLCLVDWRARDERDDGNH